MNESPARSLTTSLAGAGEGAGGGSGGDWDGVGKAELVEKVLMLLILR